MCPPRVFFPPVLWEALAIKPHWPPKSDSPGLLSLWPDPQMGNRVCLELLPQCKAALAHCFTCGLSARWPRSGSRASPPGLLQPDPLSPCRPLLTRSLQQTFKYSRQVWLQSSVGSLGPGAPKVLCESSKHLWARCLILYVISPSYHLVVGFSLGPGCEVSFLWTQRFSCGRLSSSQLQVWSSHRSRVHRHALHCCSCTPPSTDSFACA